MAHFVFYTNPLNAFGSTGYSVNLSLGADDPLRENVEAKNVKELQPLFDAWRAKCEATGKPLMCNVAMRYRNERKPAGFDKARERGGSLQAFVNTDKCPEKMFGEPKKAAPKEWSGSPCPDDPDNFWIDDKTGERVPA
jgi:hypothetical protein